MPGSSGVRPGQQAEVFSRVPKGCLPSSQQVQSTGRVEAKAIGFNRIKPTDTKESLNDMKYEVNERKY